MSLRFGTQESNVSGLIFGSQEAFESTADVFGAGAMQAQAATVVAAGIRTAVDLGTPPEFDSQVATVVGVGEVIHVGTGVLQAQDAAVAGVGAGAVIRLGTGVLQAGISTVAGAGILGVGGVGVLQARAATVVGVGEIDNNVFGVGSLVAQDATATGTGVRDIRGAGNVRSGVATVSGIGFIIELAVNYFCYLMPNTIDIEVLSVRCSYPTVFTKKRGRGVTRRRVDIKTLVHYYDGPTEQVESYRFSNGRKFYKDDT